jgi:RNA polymerase sigma-32 factor
MLNDFNPNQEEHYAEVEEQAVVGREITDAMARLNDRERLVIKNRIMAEEPESLQGLGDRLGLSRERVRQIESGALKKLKEALKESPTVLAALPART